MGFLSTSTKSGLAAGLKSMAGSIGQYQQNKAQSEREQAQYMRQQNLARLQAEYRKTENIRQEGVLSTAADVKYGREKSGRLHPESGIEYSHEEWGMLAPEEQEKAKGKGFLAGQQTKEDKPDFKRMDSLIKDVEESLAGNLGEGLAPDLEKAQRKLKEWNKLRVKAGQDELEIYTKTEGKEGEDRWLRSDVDPVDAVYSLRVKGSGKTEMTQDFLQEIADAMADKTPREQEEIIKRVEKNDPGTGEALKALLETEAAQKEDPGLLATTQPATKTIQDYVSTYMAMGPEIRKTKLENLKRTNPQFHKELIEAMPIDFERGTKAIGAGVKAIGSGLKSAYERNYPSPYPYGKN